MKIFIPKSNGFKEKLGKELEEYNNNRYASHLVDSAIHVAYSIMENWRKKGLRGEAKLRIPMVKKMFVSVKSTLMKVGGGKVRITLVAYKEYLNIDLPRTWFHKRVKGVNVGEPILKDDRIILVFKKKLPLTILIYAIGLVANLYTLDGVSIDGKEIYEGIKDVYTTNVSMSEKRVRLQTLASRKRESMKLILVKYSHREKNRVKGLVYKKVREFLKKYRSTLIVVERLEKADMFGKTAKSSSRNLFKAFWHIYHRVLENKALEYDSFVKEVSLHPTSKTCSKCWYVDLKLKAEKVFECKECRLKIDRHLNAGINVLLRMYRFPYTPSFWDKIFRGLGSVGGVTPIMGWSLMRGSRALEYGEA